MAVCRKMLVVLAFLCILPFGDFASRRDDLRDLDLDRIIKALEEVLSGKERSQRGPATGCMQSCKAPADVMLMVDKSASVFLGQGYSFLKNIATSLEIKPKMVRVGMGFYSSQSKVVIGLDDCSDSACVVNKIDAASKEFYGGTKDTLKGLKLACDVLTKDRPNAGKVAIFVTDGSLGSFWEMEDIEKELESCRKSGVVFVAIGTGPFVKNEGLGTLAGHGDRVFSARDEQGLQGLTQQIKETICQTAEDAGLYHTDVDDKTLPGCKGQQADVIFALDESGSVGKSRFDNNMKPFVGKVVEKLDIRDAAMHVGVITFSSSVKSHVDLKTENNKDDVLQTVASLPYRSGGTNTHLAINHIREQFKTNGREFTPQIGVIITDGQSNNRAATTSSATAAKNENIYLVAVGISGYVRSELVAIATPPADKNVLEVTDWNKLIESVNKLANTTCEAAVEAGGIDEFCDFENAASPLCGFQQDASSEFQWVRHSGSSGGAFTGPQFDHTFQNKSGHYIFGSRRTLQWSLDQEGKTSQIVSPPYKNNWYGQCIQFYYHMYGDSMGSLKVYLRDSQGDQKIFTKSGDQDKQWLRADITVHRKSEFRLVFEAVLGDGFQTDIAVDDVRVLTKPCIKFC